MIYIYIYWLNKVCKIYIQSTITQFYCNIVPKIFFSVQYQLLQLQTPVSSTVQGKPAG